MKKFLMFAIAATVISISNTTFAVSYVIQPGDTLQGVAYKFGVSYNDLKLANPGIDPEYIKYGVRIEIPERKVQNQRVIHIVNPVPKHQPQPQPYATQHTTPTASRTVIRIENPVPKHNSPQPQPQPYAMQHTTPTGTGLTTSTVVEEDTVY